MIRFLPKPFDEQAKFPPFLAKYLSVPTDKSVSISVPTDYSVYNTVYPVAGLSCWSWILIWNTDPDPDPSVK
jgi:hypothetical protein